MKIKKEIRRFKIRHFKTKKMVLAGLCGVMAMLMGGCSILQSPMSLGSLPKRLDALKQENEAQSSKSTEWELTDTGAGEVWEEYAYEMPEMEYEVAAWVADGYAPGQNGLSPQLAMVGSSYEEKAWEQPLEPDWNTEEYKYQEENRWLSTVTSPFSTFAADVDTASYANVRRMLLQGRMVPADAVRIEEMINYFDYDYPGASGEEPFSVTCEIAPCPWNEDTQLLMIGMKAREIPEKDRPSSNLVFLIDVSGSMDDADKLPLVQRAFRLLINELNEGDTVSIVTYANNDTVVLEGASGDEKAIICDAVEDLKAGGGTNGSQGLITAYQIAEEHFIEGGNNRILLATDGDLNIGMTDEGSLTRLIEEKAKSGVFLSVLGFGWGNISDARMEALADHGNGNYSYIDSITQARKVLIDEAGGTLYTVAKDVKLQVEFNPYKVKGYRLIGYENRTMAAESFADDTKDGGEIGSGHTVTALYEIASVDSPFEIETVRSKYNRIPPKDNSMPSKEAAEEEGITEVDGIDTDSEDAGSTEEDISYLENEWGTLHIRYKEPEGEESILIDTIIDDTSLQDAMSDNLSWAAGVAQAGMLLKDSPYAGTTDLDEVKQRLKPLTNDDDFREEFIYLLSRM